MTRTFRHPGKSRGLMPLQAPRLSPPEVPAFAGMTAESTAVIL
ncbi:MAG: hypothetical protein QOJ91_135 [Sphingomonadales bacterium]|jgi:hypothetical protein|nr:hypothetical protein [Sphingomonadales bacterium]